MGDQLPPNDRSRIEAAINELRQAMAGEDLARIRQLSTTVEQMLHTMGQQAGAAQPQGANGGDGHGHPEGTVEGEYHEV